MTTFQDWLQMKDACDEAREWVGDRDAETAWRECQRPDWMLWACGRLKLDRKLFVAIACRIARGLLYLVPASEDRPRIALETTERWLRGDATLDEVNEARDNAYAASKDGNWAGAAYAATAPSSLAPHTYATYTTYIGTPASQTKRAAECADIVREIIPWATVKAAL